VDLGHERASKDGAAEAVSISISSSVGEQRFVISAAELLWRRYRDFKKEKKKKEKKKMEVSSGQALAVCHGHGHGHVEVMSDELRDVDSKVEEGIPHIILRILACCTGEQKSKAKRSPRKCVGQTQS